MLRYIMRLPPGYARIVRIAQDISKSFDLVKISLLLFQMVQVRISELFIPTRKYPLLGYTLVVLTHTTAWDQIWGGDETLEV